MGGSLFQRSPNGRAASHPPPGRRLHVAVVTSRASSRGSAGGDSSTSGKEVMGMATEVLLTLALVDVLVIALVVLVRRG